MRHVLPLFFAAALAPSPFSARPAHAGPREAVARVEGCGDPTAVGVLVHPTASATLQALVPRARALAPDGTPCGQLTLVLPDGLGRLEAVPHADAPPGDVLLLDILPDPPVPPRADTVAVATEAEIRSAVGDRRRVGAWGTFDARDRPSVRPGQVVGEASGQVRVAWDDRTRTHGEPDEVLLDDRGLLLGFVVGPEAGPGLARVQPVGAGLQALVAPAATGDPGVLWLVPPEAASLRVFERTLRREDHRGGLPRTGTAVLPPPAQVPSPDAQVAEARRRAASRGSAVAVMAAPAAGGPGLAVVPVPRGGGASSLWSVPELDLGAFPLVLPGMGSEVPRAAARLVTALRLLGAAASLPPGTPDRDGDLERARALVREARVAVEAMNRLPDSPDRARPEARSALAALAVLDGDLCWLQSIGVTPDAAATTARAEARAAWQRALDDAPPADVDRLRTLILVRLGRALAAGVGGDRRAERAAAVEALRQADDAATALAWIPASAAIRLRVGQVLLEDLPAGAPPTDAIWALQQAQDLVTPASDPFTWGSMRDALGLAFTHTTGPDRPTHVRWAIEAFQDALTVRPREAHPALWAETRFHESLAWLALPPSPDSASHCTAAIAGLEDVLSIWSPTTDLPRWVAAQRALGTALATRPSETRSLDLQRAVTTYETALGVVSRESDPRTWALLQADLGAAWAGVQAGDRAAAVQRAIAADRAALAVLSATDDPATWSQVQDNLGMVLLESPTGDRAANVGAAIEAFTQALTARSPERDPAEWATTQTHLALAWQALPAPDRLPNLERAVGLLKAVDSLPAIESLPALRTLSAERLALARLALAEGYLLAGRTAEGRPLLQSLAGRDSPLPTEAAPIPLAFQALFVACDVPTSRALRAAFREILPGMRIPWDWTAIQAHLATLPESPERQAMAALVGALSQPRSEVSVSALDAALGWLAAARGR